MWISYNVDIRGGHTLCVLLGAWQVVDGEQRVSTLLKIRELYAHEERGIIIVVDGNDLSY